jgi:hypothetical protein
VATFVPGLAAEQVERLPDRACEVVEYRKSGLSGRFRKFFGVGQAGSLR